MSTRAKAAPPYYFVPLGRERGGLLDFLGLPPEAKLAEVADKEAAYRLELTNNVKVQKKALRKRLEAGELTQQEFDAQAQKLEDERTAKEQALNEMYERFEQLNAEKRGIENKRRELEARFKGGELTRQVFEAQVKQFEDDGEEVWFEMYRAFGDERELWQFLTRPRQLPQVRPEALVEAERRWIVPHLAGVRGGAGGARAAQEPAATEPLDLTALSRLLTESHLICLLAADALWSRLRHTNRERWSALVEEWAEEVAALGPNWCREAVGPRPPAYPGLHRPTRLTVSLSAVEEGERAGGGGRAGSRERVVTLNMGEEGTTYLTTDELLAMLEQLRQESQGQ